MSAPHLRVDNAGLLTTVQDRGRFGWEHIGVARGGAADLPAFIWSNRLALNQDDAAVLEMTLLGTQFTASGDCWVSTTGATDVVVDGAERPPWSGLWLHSGSVLEVKELAGARAYIGVNGGIQVPPVLGSRSTHLESGFGGFHGRALRRGDELQLLTTDVGLSPRLAFRHPCPPQYKQPVVAGVVLGPRLAAFDAGAVEIFLNTLFRVSPQSNHVGLRLDGAFIPAPSRGTRISEPMPIGGVQITPAGQPIVLLGSRGTIGGYPLLATVATSSVWSLGQARPGDEVRFQAVTPEEARALTISALRDETKPIVSSL